MRFRTFVTLAVLAGSAAAALPASAFDFWNRPDRRDRDFDPDKAAYLEERYGYKYEPRGYYPYYNSGYFGPPRIVRYRGELPPYFSSWGAPRHDYRHVEWHRQEYGGHRRGNW